MTVLFLLLFLSYLPRLHSSVDLILNNRHVCIALGVRVEFLIIIDKSNLALFRHNNTVIFKIASDFYLSWFDSFYNWVTLRVENQYFSFCTITTQNDNLVGIDRSNKSLVSSLNTFWKLNNVPFCCLAYQKVTHFQTFNGRNHIKIFIYAKKSE